MEAEVSLTGDVKSQVKDELQVKEDAEKDKP